MYQVSLLIILLKVWQSVKYAKKSYPKRRTKVRKKEVIQQKRDLTVLPHCVCIHYVPVCKKIIHHYMQWKRFKGIQLIANKWPGTITKGNWIDKSVIDEINGSKNNIWDVPLLQNDEALNNHKESSIRDYRKVKRTQIPNNTRKIKYVH